MKVIITYNNDITSEFEMGDEEDFKKWVNKIIKKKVWFIDGKNNGIAIMIDKINFIEEVRE